jgi:hypothetical protein
MNESEARRVLLVCAYESPPQPPWSEADADAATREAARAVGEAASDEALIVRRAQLAAQRIAERDPAAARALGAVDADRHWIGGALVLLVFALGVASDAVGPTQRIDILAPPLLALLAWNVAVYLSLVARPRAAGRLRDALRRALERPLHETSPPLARFAARWTAFARPLYGARVAALLHAAAAALALGALASLYVRGLAFEYRAGWDSTFLDAGDVHALLSAVLGPASRLAGLSLPDAPALETLRWSAGGGENAARWIHLHAITVALVVLLPRSALAAAAAWRAHRWSRAAPLSLDDPYFKRIANARSGRALAIHVLPYSYAIADELAANLRSALERELGAPVALQVAPSVRPDDDAPAPPVDATWLVLFALTATPERETHGAFVQALTRARADPPPRVWIDESAFRQRFGATRLAERRAAWQRMLAEIGIAPVFVDLAA